MPLLRRLKPDWLTVLSALLIVLSFPPWNLGFLIWICLIPWFFAIQRSRNSSDAVVQGAWLSFFMTAGGFYWIAMVLREFGQIPWIIAIGGFMLFAPLAQLQFLAFAPIGRGASRWMLGKTASRWRSLGFAVGAAFFYAGIDWLLPKLFRDTLGHSFYNSPWMRQLADLGGAPLLTFGVFLVNHAFFISYRRLRMRRESSIWPALGACFPQLLFAFGCLIASIAYGRVRYDEIHRMLEMPHASVQFGVIQGNIGDFDKVASEKGVRGAAHKVLETHFSLSDDALALTPKPEILVWPETSYPSTFRNPQTSDELARDQMTENFVRTRGVPLFFGGYDYKDGKDFNAFFFLLPKADPTQSGSSDLQVYRKNILLLFGEYIPGADTFNIIKRTFPQVGNFGRGAGPEVLTLPLDNPKVPTLKVGPIICYEALFPDFVLDAARKGSQLILNITNDSWFGPTAEPELHLSLAVFRSIEARLPQIRGTNTGISALVMPDGEIVQKTGIFRPEVLNVTVPVLPPVPTLMLKWGEWFGWFALIAGTILLVGLGWVTRSEFDSLNDST